MIRIYLYGHLKICFLTQRPPHYPRQSHGVVAEVVRNDLPLAARFEIASFVGFSIKSNQPTCGKYHMNLTTTYQSNVNLCLLKYWKTEYINPQSLELSKAQSLILPCPDQPHRMARMWSNGSVSLGLMEKNLLETCLAKIYEHPGGHNSGTTNPSSSFCWFLLRFLAAYAFCKLILSKMSNVSCHRPALSTRKGRCRSIRWLATPKPITAWWLNQPIWKIWSSKWYFLPQGSGVKIKNVWVATT